MARKIVVTRICSSDEAGSTISVRAVEAEELIEAGLQVDLFDSQVFILLRHGLHTKLL